MGDRILAWALRLYPQDFRAQHGPEMRLTFRRLLDRSGPGWARRRAWVAGVLDLVRGGVRERLRGVRRTSPDPHGTGGREMMGRWVRDLRYAVRTLRREPLFTLVAAGSLAIGIGANTAVFSVANALLLRPLPGIPNYERVVELGRASRGEGFDTFAYPDFLDLRDQVPALEDAAAFSIQILSVAREDGGVRANGLLVSPAYFPVLGATPGEGRFFLKEEDQGEGEHAVAVVSHAFWEGELGGDPAVVGSTLLLNRIPHTVVGVTRPGFHGHMMGLAPDVYLPFMQAPVVAGEDFLDHRGASWHMALGLLAPGATPDQLNEQLATVGDRLAQAHPGTNEHRSFRAIALGPVPGGGRSQIRLFMTALLGMVGLILLVTCTNVAGMFLARGVSREREVAVRLAVGAGRGALIQQLTVETLLVFLLGGGMGAALGAWAVGLLRPELVPAPVPLRLDLAPDGRVLLFALGVTLLTGLAFGLFPAARAARVEVSTSLKEGRGGEGRTGRLRTAFAGAQVGLSLILLVTAALFVRSLQRAASIETGFDPDGGYTTLLDLSLEGYGEEDGRVFHRELLEGLRGEGWIQAAALSGDLPLDLGRSGTVAVPEGWEATPEAPGLGVDFNRVSDGYFEALAIPVRSGRAFLPSDREDARAVAVVSETFAREAWPGEDPLGRTLRFGGFGDAADVLEVVGVVADVKNQLITETPSPFVYRPLAQSYAPTTQVVVKTPLAPAEATGRLRQALLEADPSLSLGAVVSLERYTSVGTLPQRIAAGLTTSLGLLALLLSGLGIYGVVSFAVGRQQREIGIRMALGASRGSVVGRFLRRGVLLALPGMAVGVALSLLAARGLQTLLLELSPHDPVALGTVSLLLLGVVVLATWIPARRAARVDPARSLRSE